MPNQATAKSPRHRGWYFDQVNNRLAAVFNGTEILDFDANDVLITPATTVTGALVGSGAITAGTGLTVTAGDGKITAGNLRLGAIETFATTEPTSAVVMKTGTAPAGAITTSGGIFSSATVVQKIIAAGTVSNIET